MINKEEIERIIKNEDEGSSLDYKEDLVLDKEGDKAEFVKDVVALANSSEVAHIIIGVEDKTRKLVGQKTSHKAEQLNDILKNRCDPPISLKYKEEDIYGYKVGVIEIKGENPPYIISVIDKFGGKRSCGKTCHINRGTIYIRNHDKNEGASREHIEKIYKDKVKYVTVQADLQFSHKSNIKHLEELKEVEIDFDLTNIGSVLASEPFLFIHLYNVEKITKLKNYWTDVTNLNPRPTAQFYSGQPVASIVNIGGFTARVKKEIKQIDTRVEIFSMNMATKRFEYAIPLDS
jgi:predicted HTH transcriptional regulator